MIWLHHYHHCHYVVALFVLSLGYCLNHPFAFFFGFPFNGLQTEASHFTVMKSLILELFSDLEGIVLFDPRL